MATDTKRTLGLLSVCAPVYDEEALVEAFYNRMTAALEGLDYELIIVDDGSKDSTPEKLDALAAADPRLRVVHLSRNFGHQAALTAGLEHARGDAVVMLDADLQDPPERIPDMLEAWRGGADVVYMVREERHGETPFKLATARWFYKIFRKLAQVELEPNSGDFRLLDRRALDALLSMGERNRFLRGMTVWVGFTQTAMHYKRDPRHAGETKYPVRKMLRFSLDAIASFSHLPLQIATYLGFLFAGIAFIAIPVVIGLKFAGGYLPGFGTVTILILMIGGLQLIALGLIGEYIGRIYDEAKRRPLYIVREQRNEPVARARHRARRRTVGFNLAQLAADPTPVENRNQRVLLETDRHRIRGEVTLGARGLPQPDLRHVECLRARIHRAHQRDDRAARRGSAAELRVHRSGTLEDRFRAAAQRLNAAAARMPAPPSPAGSALGR